MWPYQSEAEALNAVLRLSLIASDQGRYREAVEEAMSGFRTRRPEPELLQALARRLGQLGETRAMATSALDPAILEARNGLLQAELGSVLANHHFPLDALRLLDAAARNDFRAPALDYVTGQCLVVDGGNSLAEERA